MCQRLLFTVKDTHDVWLANASHVIRLRIYLAEKQTYRVSFFFFIFFFTFSLTFCLSIRRSSISSRLVGIEMLGLRIRVEYSVADLSGALPPTLFFSSVIFVILSAGVTPRVTNISSLRSTAFEASGKIHLIIFVHDNNYFIESQTTIILSRI